MRGNVYLVGSGQSGLLSSVAERAYAAIGKPRAHVAVSYAPVAGDAAGYRFMSGRMASLFPDAILDAIDDNPSAVDRADLVFISGGDPTLGAKVLEKSGTSARLRAAVQRGTPVMGVSAGAIVLGEWWVEWPDTSGASTQTPGDDAALVRCARVAEGYVFDTHNEEDDWDELRIARDLLRRHGESPILLGIPTGGALIYKEGGDLEVVGVPPFKLS